jgi:WD40 repeat protein
MCPVLAPEICVELKFGIVLFFSSTQIQRVLCAGIVINGTLLASGSFDKTVKIWDLKGTTPTEKATLTGHSGTVTSVALKHVLLTSRFVGR